MSTRVAAPASPYKGLAAFEDSELDALLFFGRERESEIITANLTAYRLTILYGATGVGKSSVLRAGVAHTLRRQADAEVAAGRRPEVVVVVFDGWSGEVVPSLRDAVRFELGRLFGADAVPDDTPSLADDFAAWTEALGCELLLILDQAEEFFLYHGPGGAGSFADELGELTTRHGLHVNVLVSLRDDALAKLDRFKSRVPRLLGNYLRLDHLDRGSARRAIEEPLREYNRLAEERVELDPALVEAVLDQTAAGRLDAGLSGRGAAEPAAVAGRIEAPYLQLVMERLWDEERAEGSKRLRLETLEALGGAGEIVRRHLVNALEGLNLRERDLAASLFNYLVTPSGTKIAHGIADLAGYAAADESDVRPVVHRLLGERILRAVTSNGEADSGSYEIFHDVLAEPIVAWRANHLAQRTLERQQAEANRRHRRLLLISAAMLGALLAVTAVTVFALVQRSHAHRAAARARTREAEATAARAIEELPVDANGSLRLAAAAARLRPTNLTEAVLRQALVESHERAILPARGGVRAASFSPDGRLIVAGGDDGRTRVYDARRDRLLYVLRAGGPVTTAAFSPDSKVLATGSAPGGARLWAARSGRLLHVLGRGHVESTAFSADGRLNVVAGDDRAARIWRVRAGTLARVLRHDGPVLAASFSPDGRRVVTVAEDHAGRHRAYVFDAATGRRMRMLPAKGVTRAVFSPNGALIATASVAKIGGYAVVWRARTGRRLHVLAHEGHVVDVSFSPDGKELVTASEDGAGYVWDVASGARRLLLVGPTAAVESASFSPDGNSIVIASRDRTARVYAARNGLFVALLAGHADSVTSASWSPDSRLVVTDSDDGTARVWEPGTADRLRVLTRHPGGVLGASFSADGSVVVSAGADGRVRLTSAATGRQLQVLRQPGLRSASLSHNGRRLVTTASGAPVRIWDASSGRARIAVRHAGASSASFSPDDSLFVTAGRDGKARIWRTSTGRLIAVLQQGRAGDEARAAFSPDGARVLTMGLGDGTGRIWDASDGHLVHTLHTHQGSVVGGAFSPDGSTVVTAGGDGTARLWSAASGARLHVLSGHTAALTGAVFSPAGRLLVTAGSDGDARVWDVRTGRNRAVLRQFSPVSAVSFSPDGRWILTAGATTAILWQTATGGLFAYLRGHSVRVVPLVTALFAPNGTLILTAGRDGTVRTYVCAICGGVGDLLQLARAREARIARR